jgi:hypothetical protein
MSCAPIFYNFNSAVNDAICNSFFNGIFVLFVTHYILAGSLFFVMMIVVSQFHYIIDAIGPEGEKETVSCGEIEMVMEEAYMEPHILPEGDRRKPNEAPKAGHHVRPEQVLYWG